MEEKIRKLAKSIYFQNLYNNSKELSNVQMFENVSNFSTPQTSFLYWVVTYNILYQELQTHEDEYLTAKVIEDDVRCDAYLLHRKNKHDFFWKNRRLEEAVENVKRKHPQLKGGGKTSVCKVDLRPEK